MLRRMYNASCDICHKNTPARRSALNDKRIRPSILLSTRAGNGLGVGAGAGCGRGAGIGIGVGLGRGPGTGRGIGRGTGHGAGLGVMGFGPGKGVGQGGAGTGVGAVPTNFKRRSSASFSRFISSIILSLA